MITNFTEGTLVTNGSEYAVVKNCIHGNPYYALIGYPEDGYTAEEIANAKLVADWDEVNVNECCG